MTESSLASMREQIARTYNVIRPYLRRTPVVDVNAADFGLDPMPLVLKLELMQHTGSFKTRGAFSNLLTRAVPAAGGSGVGRQSRSGGGVCREGGRQGGAHLRAHGFFSGEDGTDPLLWRGAGG